MQNSNFEICIAGAIAAAIVDFTVYPFDTLKTRIQSTDYEKLYKDPKTGSLRRNLLFKGLYQGVWSVVLSAIPSSGAFFLTYETIKSTLTPNPQKPECNRFPITNSLPTPITHALASSTGELVACLMTTPAEVLKQNAQVVDNASGKTPSGTGNQSEKREDQRHASMKVFSRFKGQPWKLWSGYSALVARNLPSTGLQFPIYEFVRGHVGEWRRQMKGASGGVHGWSAVVERAGVTGFSAAVSGAISAIVTTPIDVVKTRMMLSAGDGKVTAQGGSGESSDGAGDGEKKKKKNPSTLAVGRQIFREEGIKGLFRGGLIRVGWTALSLSMYLTIYEGSRFYLENRRKKKEKTNGDGIYNYT